MSSTPRITLLGPKVDTSGLVIYRDEDFVPERKHPRRVQLDIDGLSKKLRVPRELVKAYLQAAELREMGRGAQAAGWGLCSHELTSLAHVGHLASERRVKLESAVRVGRQILDELLRLQATEQLLLVVVESNKTIRSRLALTALGNDVVDEEIPPEVRPYATIYHVSAHWRATDDALEEQPLEIPSVTAFARGAQT